MCLSTVNNIAPLNGASISGESSSTRMERYDLDSDISSYEVLYGTDEFADANTIPIETRSANIDVTAGNNYYWKVKTIDDQGNTSTSEVFTFSVE